jgi:chromosome segregation ATPase
MSYDKKREKTNSRKPSLISRKNSEELDEDADKYKKMAKKLARDKVELKDKLKEVVDDAEIKINEFKDEINDYKKRILTLEKEKNKAINQLEKTKEKIEEQTEELEKEYEDKYIKLREQIEKKYTEKESDISKKYLSLSSQLYQKWRTGEKFRPENDIEVKFCDTLNIQLQELKEQIEREKKVVLEEKNSALFHAKETIEIMNKDFEAKKEKEMKNINSRLLQVRGEYDTKVNELSEKLKSKDEELKKVLSETVQRHNLELEALSKEYSETIKNIQRNFSIQKENFSQDHDKEVDNLQKTIKKLQEAVKTTTELNNNKLAEKEAEYKRIYSQFNTKLEEKNKDVSNAELMIQKIRGEAEDIISNFREQIKNYQNTIQKLQENIKTINSQYVVQLAEQKVNYEGIIKQKDTAITRLDAHLQKITKETIENLNIMEKKSKDTFIANKELTLQIDELKNKNELITKELYNTRTELNNSRNNIEKLRDNLSITEINLKNLQKSSGVELQTKEYDIEMYIKRVDELKGKIITDRNRISELQKKIGSLNSELESRETKLQELCRQLETIRRENNDLNTHMSENIKKQVEINTEKYTKTLSELNNKFSMSENNIKNLAHKNVNLESALYNMKVERDKLKLNNELLKNEADDTKNQIKNLNNDLRLSSGRILILENMISTAENDKQNYSKEITALIDIKNKLSADINNISKQFSFHKQTSATLTQKLNDENKLKSEKIKELEEQIEKNKNLEKEVSRLKNQLSLSFTGLRNTLHKKEEEITSLKDSLNIYKDKDVKFQAQELEIKRTNEVMTNLKDIFDENTRKLQEAHKIERERMEKEIQDVKSIAQKVKNDCLVKVSTIQSTIGKVINEKDNIGEKLKEYLAKESSFIEKDREVKNLHKAFSSIKSDYENKEKILEEKYKKQISDLLNEQKSQLSFIQKLKENYEKQVEELKIAPDNIKKQLELITSQKEQLQNMTDQKERDIQKLKTQIIDITDAVKVKMESLSIRESELKQYEEKLRLQPPVLLDPQVRKERDEANIEIRKLRLEIAELKTKTTQ